eukprot:gene6664-18242_t
MGARAHAPACTHLPAEEQLRKVRAALRDALPPAAAPVGGAAEPPAVRRRAAAPRGGVPHSPPLFSRAGGMGMDGERWVAHAAAWRPPAQLRAGDRFSAPVLRLRFTRDAVDSRVHFRNQHSLYRPFDRLQTGQLAPACVA